MTCLKTLVVRLLIWVLTATLLLIRKYFLLLLRAMGRLRAAPVTVLEIETNRLCGTLTLETATFLLTCTYLLLLKVREIGRLLATLVTTLGLETTRLTGADGREAERHLPHL